MKRNLLFILVALLPVVASAVDAQELTVSDVEFIDLNRFSEDFSIVLTKEGSILNVQLLNYPGHPSTQEFVITTKMSGGSDGEPCSVSIGVSYINNSETAIITTFNVSFNVHDIEANSFYFSCWWYNGMVSLTEGEPLELWESKNISKDGVIYTLDNETKTATLSSGRYVEGEYNIPSELDYGGQTFTLTSIEYPAFSDNTSLTSVIIPQSVTNIGNAVFYRCSNLSDVYCYAENIPETGINVFNECPVASATLHVPAGSVEKYKAASPWNEFGNIVALDNVDWQEEPIFSENKTFTVGNSSCTRIIYQGRIGYDFESALDSLTRKYEPILNVLETEGHYSGEGLNINEEIINVDFYYDNREFKLLTFIDKANIYNYLFTTDVIDEKGNHYYFVECNDEPFVSFTKGQIATIILPIAPDASKGRYFRLDRMEDGKIIFEEELHPQVRTPYVIVPNEDFSIDPSTLDLDGLTADKAMIENDEIIDVEFRGYYKGGDMGLREGSRNFLLDTTPDCVDRQHDLYFIHVGSLRAFFMVRWRLCKTWEKLEYVLYSKDGTIVATSDPVTFTKDQMATIILPTVPDASKGKYYRLDRCEEGKIIFEQELQPQAHIPYIIVPNEDFSIDPGTLDLAGLSPDTVSIEGISFIGSYSRKELNEQEGWYIDIIDTTPDCGFSSLGETGKGAFIGALRAYLTVNWDDPYHPGGTKSPAEKMEIVLKDNPNGLSSLTPDPSPVREGSIYDLQGRKISGKPAARGIYIENGKKKVK